jgi:hypothetical protein
MYDSITFHLEENQFKIRNERLFDGKRTNQINGRFDTGSSFVDGIRNYMKKNKKYYPSINLTERTIGNNINGKKKIKRLEIQISLPKALYETNKYEINQDDLSSILKKTVEYLEMAGISTDTKNLKNGVLEKLALSKSIILPTYYGTTEKVIKKLAPFNYKPRCNFRYRDYDDGWQGVSIKFHNPVRGFGVYCKYSEIVNNGYTLIEEEIKRQVLSGIQPKNIIRFELTLQRKQTLEAVLKRLIQTKKKDFTLNDIFTNKGIAPKLLLEEFDKVYNPLSITLITLSEMKENQLDHLLRSKIGTLKDRALMFYLVNMTTKIGLSKTLELAKRETSNSSYERIKKTLPKIKQELDGIDENMPNLIEFLRNELVKFEPIKPEVEKRHCQLLLNEA